MNEDQEISPENRAKLIETLTKCLGIAGIELVEFSDGSVEFIGPVLLRRSGGDLPPT